MNTLISVTGKWMKELWSIYDKTIQAIKNHAVKYLKKNAHIVNLEVNKII